MFYQPEIKTIKKMIAKVLDSQKINQKGIISCLVIEYLNSKREVFFDTQLDILKGDIVEITTKKISSRCGRSHIQTFIKKRK